MGPGSAQFALAVVRLGAVVVTLVILALHSVRIGQLTGILPAALLFPWLRQRTGNLVMPILVQQPGEPGGACRASVTSGLR